MNSQLTKSPGKDSPQRKGSFNTPITPTSVEVSPIKKISDTKCPVMLAFSSKLGKHVAMKLFPFQDQLRVSKLYKNESRFAHLSHPNIVSILGSKEHREIPYKETTIRVSYILMDLAFCDFEEILPEIKGDEKLVRTYFLQMIDGLKYLHSNEIAHLDLKLANLLLGRDYLLKITDFESSFKNGDEAVFTVGNLLYAAPELLNKECRDPFMADMYSAGIILFMFMFGFHPFEGFESDYNLHNLMFKDQNAFWETHEKIQGKKLVCSEEFKELFAALVNDNVEERAIFDEITNCDWAIGPVYSYKELCGLMKKKLQGKFTHVEITESL